MRGSPPRHRDIRRGAAMSKRPLTPAEAALWKRVIATVEPLERRPKSRGVSSQGAGPGPKAPDSKTANNPAVTREIEKRAFEASLRGTTSLGAKSSKVQGPTTGWTFSPAPKPSPAPAGTLDGSWDRRLGRGVVAPDVTVDLHGYNLETAYHRLDQALDLAISSGFRLMLLITGKPRISDSGRGAIRAAVADWLTSSRHARDIAAVRNAHPRHGGQGALYIVLRRRR